MNGSLILCYHGIVPEPVPITDRLGISTEVKLFRQQMEVLARRWSIVPLHDLVGQILSGSLRPGQAAITFDDGNADNYQHAFPVLQDMGIPAIIFLITGLVDRSVTPWWDRLANRVRTATGGALRLPPDLGDTVVDLSSVVQSERAYSTLRERLNAIDSLSRNRILDALDDQPPRCQRALSWPEVEKMHRCGIAVGAHTHSHPSLVATSDAALQEEILRSRDLITARLGVSPSFFAYPYGHVDARVARAVEAAGFLAAVTTHEAPCSSAPSPFLLPRVSVGNWKRDVFGRRLDEVCGRVSVIRRVYRSVRSNWKTWRQSPRNPAS